jgi:hypothetical protein
MRLPRGNNEANNMPMYRMKSSKIERCVTRTTMNCETPKERYTEMNKAMSFVTGGPYQKEIRERPTSCCLWFLFVRCGGTPSPSRNKLFDRCRIDEIRGIVVVGGLPFGCVHR